MKNTNKKGFTIVELVIVVAVIAILAAVLIPTFAGIIDSANKYKDTQLVKNLNTAIAADAENDDTMSGAIKSAAKFGYDIEKINASATGNQILWDSVNNVFCYLQDSEIKYIPEFPGAKNASDADYWVIANAVDATYSTYLVNYDGASIEAKHSLDISACGAVDVTYAGSAVVSIFTNGGNLTVNSGTVNHYGAARYLEVADGATYNEYGTVVANLAEVDTLTEEEIVAESWTKVATAEELTEALVNGGNIVLVGDISIENEISTVVDGKYINLNAFEVTKDTVINLNGHNIVGLHTNSVDTLNKNNVLINVQNASLTLCGYGLVSLQYEGTNMQWNALSATLRLSGSTGTININDAVVVEHLGGTPMSYAIDSYASGNANTINLNGGALYSSYIAIRVFYPNATTTGTVNVNGGALFGTSRDIWLQGSTADNTNIVKIANTYKVTVNGVSYYID